MRWLDWKKYSREDAYTVSVFNEVAREVAGRNVTKLGSVCLGYNEEKA